jgi:pyruvate-formate lyase-activating enzyme
VVYRNGQAYCGAVQTDANPHWAPERYAGDTGPLRQKLIGLIEGKKALHPGNRVLDQLTTCALEYGCYNAQNLFWNRWEAAVTVSPACNAECIGCISLQPDGLPPSPQERFRFVPSVAEIVELGLAHLQADDSIYAFGQGCEGEPLLQADRIADSVRAIRAVTDRGTVHLNTNASRPIGFRKVCEAGLDSVRISLNSVLSEQYTPYYQPRGYTFEDVRECARIARDLGLVVYLNYLHVPGWNDREQEIDALVSFVRDCGVRMIQMRTLNIDPDLYASSVSIPGGVARGIPVLLSTLKAECPGLRIGNHTLPRKSFDV